ncbi:MAG: nickel pincer cofactor biosynthesis protein LarC [Acidobacteria bacterium]|nr:nickel pincer cofactor biosynthesis protein LarC [Acidobacteriota bacterium]
MRVLYLDLTSGVSGDMLLGALVDVGVPPEVLSGTVAALRSPVSLSFEESSRGGLRGIKAEVEAPDDRGHRYLRDFLSVLERSGLSAAVRERAADLLRRIFEAEAEVHGKTAESVHLHELGSLDTLVDIVGAVAGVAHLAPDHVVSSAVNLGSGSVEAEHGTLEIPAPATGLLLRGVPTFSDGSGFERATPTGAVLTGLADSFGGWPAMTPERVGYGLGTADPQQGRPNALRAVLGSTPDRLGRTVTVIEATLDDLQPEIAPHLLERLLAAGARDAFFTPVQMKKGRPGLALTVLVDPAGREAVVGTLFSESTTLGVRISEAERDTLERRVVSVETSWGPVGLKLGMRNGAVVNRAPEFEDCRRLAEAAGVPLKEVFRQALAAPLPESSGGDPE